MIRLFVSYQSLCALEVITRKPAVCCTERDGSISRELGENGVFQAPPGPWNTPFRLSFPDRDIRLGLVDTRQKAVRKASERLPDRCV
jgi:hypothetical protein